MNKKNNRKGFSLVEILAAIVILGLLSSIAIVSVNYILKKAETEYYKSQIDEIILAAKSYTQDNRNSLPKRVGMRKEVTLKSLQNKKYIGKVVDRHKNECDAEGTKVQIYKYDKTHYSYSVTLVCPSYNNKTSEKAAEEADISVSYDGIDTENIDYTKVYAKVNIKYNNTDDNDLKITSYNYIIYRNEQEVKNSGDIEGKLKTNLDIKIPLENYTPGNIKIKVIVIDQYGNSTEKEFTKKIENKNAPTCTIIKENKEWTNQTPIEVSVKCISKSNKGCQKDIYTQVFTDPSQTGTIEMMDKEGNKGACQVNTYIDMEPPSTPVIDNEYHDTWVNKNYTIKISSVDEESGIKQFEYRYPNSTLTAADGKPENEWHVWENSSKDPGEETPFESTEFKRERGEILEVRAVDKAGNYSEVSTTIIKIDKTAPTILTINNPYLNTWFNKQQYEANTEAYVVTITSQDNLSGISYEQYKYPESTNSWVKYDNSGNTDESTNKEKYTFVTTPFKKERNEKVSFQVCDRAGNCSEGDSFVKIDRTPPTITISNPYPNWFNKSDYESNADAFKITSTAKDSTSGLASHDYKHSDESTWTTKNLTSTSAVKSDKIQTGPYKTEMNKSLTFRAYDVAGNYTESSTNIKVDITAPSCSISVSSGTLGNNSWYISNVSLKLSHSDSDVKCYGLGKSSNVTCGSTDTGTQSETTGTTWYGIVEDNAGNKATCKSSLIKVDTTAPTVNLKLVSSSDTSTSVYSKSFTGTTSASISSWQNQLLKDYVTFSDSGSGISGNLTAGYNSPGATSSNTTISSSNINTNRTSGSYSGVIVEGYRYMEYSVSDNAGNKTLVKFKVNIDTTDPTCDISVSGTQGNNSWYTSNPTISLSKSDSGPSGISSFGLSTSGYTINSTSSKTQSSDTTGTGTWYGKVTDKAGNYATCTHSSIKVDTTAPEGHITMLNQDVYSSYNFGTVKSKVSSLEITGSDKTSGIVTSGNIRFNEAGLSSCSYSDTLKYTKQYTLTSGSYTLSNPLTSDGCRYINVTLTDKAGNSKEIKALVNQSTAPVDNNPDGVCTYIDINVRTSKDVNGNAISWNNCNCGTVDTTPHTTAHYIVCKYNGKYYDKRYYYRTIKGDSNTDISPTFVCPNALNSGDVGKINAGEEITRKVGGVKYKFLTTSQSSTITWWAQYKF